MRLRILALAIAVLLVAAVSVAEPTEFLLVDGDGKPVAGARVSVLHTGELSETDARGAFFLKAPPTPPFELSVFDKSGAWLGNVAVANLEPGARTLVLQRGVEANVTVRGGVPIETQAPPANATSVVTQRETAEMVPLHLTNALAEIPGVSQIDEGQTAVPSIRGLARGRTLLLIDNARVTAERRAGPSATFLDPASLQSIEVVRGPGTVAYGSDSIGGVIHSRTPMPTTGDFSGRLQGTLGFGIEGYTTLAETNLPVGKGAALLQAHYNDFDDYDSPVGTVPDSGAQERGFLVRGLIPFENASRLLLTADIDQARDVGKPSLETTTTPTRYPLEDSYRFSGRYDFRPFLGFDTVSLDAFGGEYRLVTDRDRLPTPAQPRQISRSDVISNDASLRVMGARPLGKGRLRAGFDGYSRFNLEAVGETIRFNEADEEIGRLTDVSVEDASSLTTGLFFETEQMLLPGRLEVSAGLRGDLVSIENVGGYYGDQSRDDEALSGFLAARVLFGSGSSATLQYAEGYRQPTLSDRYFRGVSGRGFVTGNPDLEPERSRQWDLAYRTFLGSSTRVAVYGYYYEIHDLIERYQEGTNFFFRNRGEEELVGGEVEIDTDISPRLSARATFSIARGEIVDDGSDAADVPPMAGTVSFRHQVTDRHWYQLGLWMQARDDRPGPTETTTPGYATVDLAAGTNIGSGVGLGVRVRNLLDHVYPESPDAAATLAPGRAFTISVAKAF
jgi:outer membrane receptor protein involved in Fe transport